MTTECLLKCIALPTLAAIPFGYIGARIGRRIGTVASHAISWLLMFLAAGACYLVAAYLERPTQFVSDFQQGISVVAIFVGLCVATPIELLLYGALFFGPKAQRFK